MRASTAIGVNNDFAPGQATIALWATDHEATGRVDQIFGTLQPFTWQHWFANLFDYRFFDLLMLHFRGMLGRQNHRVDRDRLAIDIAQRDLGFGIRAQPWQAAILAQLRLTLHQTVCE